MSMCDMLCFNIVNMTFNIRAEAMLPWHFTCVEANTLGPATGGMEVSGGVGP